MDTLYTFWGNITHFNTKSAHFLGLMNSATKEASLQAAVALHGCRLALSIFASGFYISRHQATGAGSSLGQLLGKLELLHSCLSSMDVDTL